MRARPWDPEYKIPWTIIKSAWEEVWNLKKPILLEKSPPNLMRAFEIQEAFSPSNFIVTIRDPYAFCEGYTRRQKTSYGESASSWATWAGFQRRNIEELERSLFFTYESFTEHPEHISNKILQFIPQLERLEPNNDFQAQSIIAYEARKITNLNQIKISQLSVRDIKEINKILERHCDLLDFFGYTLIDPKRLDELSRLKSTILLKAIQIFARAKRVSRRTFTKTQK